MLRAVFAAVPLLTLPVIAYGLLAASLGGAASPAAAAAIAHPLFTLTTAGGGLWPVSAGDLLLVGGLAAGFIDLIKGAPDRRAVLVNHALTIILFATCLAALLLAPAFASSCFFLLTLMVLLDLAAGLISAYAQAEPPSRR